MPWQVMYLISYNIILNQNLDCFADINSMDSGHNGHKPERPKPKRPQTETATNRNGHRPERPQT